MQILDTHVYVISDDDAAYPRIANAADWVQYAVTVEQLVPMMDAAGVAKGTLIQALQAHGYDNSYTIDCARSSGGRFVAVGMYDLQAPETAAKLRHEVTQLGVRGARINPRDLNSAEALHSWHVASELGVPLLVAVSRPNAYSAIEDMAQKFPSVKVVLEGLGLADETYEGPPFDKQQPLFDLARNSNIYLKWCTDQLVDIATLEMQRAFFGKLAGIFGAERVMWGSRYPYRHEPEWTYGSQVAAALAVVSAFGEREQRLLMGEAALAIWPELA